MKKRKKEFVNIVKRTERPTAELAKIYRHRFLIGGLMTVAGLLTALVPSFVRPLNSFFAVGLMLGMPTALLGTIAFAMYWIMWKRLPSS